jgi:hypothetical protein
LPNKFFKIMFNCMDCFMIQVIYFWGSPCTILTGSEAAQQFLGSVGFQKKHAFLLKKKRARHSLHYELFHKYVYTLCLLKG